MTLPSRLWRYLLVGGVVYLADLAIYAAMVHLAPNAYLLANGMGKIAGAALGFVLHRRFTFSGAQRDGIERQVLSYAGLLLLNLALSSVMLWFALVVVGADALLGRVAVDAIVILVSFVGMRMWVYRAA